MAGCIAGMVFTHPGNALSKLLNDPALKITTSNEARHGNLNIQE